ncbi:Negative regulator of mitotic exit [Friedmanniomyces endolithicus]|nr:Negative regulator of mitotic exit [Friedmanniomyces endolithicus]
MSFLFKSKAKNGLPTSALPNVSRDIRSSDGPPSQIPMMNGSKPGSPTPQQQGSSVNNSLSSLAGTTFNGGDGGRSSSAPPQEEIARQQYLRSQQQSQQPNGGVGMGMGMGMGMGTGMGGGAGMDGLNRSGTASPNLEQKSLNFRDTSRDTRLPVQTTRAPPTDSSPYPWSQRRLNFTVSHTNPFPRYGAAVNATSSKDGSIYLMGGLINGSTVKGDLWMVEAGLPTPGTMGNQSMLAGSQMTCYPVATTSEGPGPRVGHASLLVGNAFIVFGGDTKMDEGDQLDDTLYLLNTSTKQWSRALPAGPRPPGRYGHTLNILGSKIYIFGGQVEGYFFNDLVAFDLNALQQATNRWEILIQNTIDGGPPHGQIPPARTNHTIISYNDRLYLFGGTDGVHWYNDVWSYSFHTNSWTQLDCIGYIPSPREGHAAALVGDVMYIFGGRTEEGNDLGDLAAFRITSRRWYTFQNMGPSPSPRSGHSMTTVGKSIVVLAGEPSSAPRDPVELGMAYYLDTAKIRYPPDSASQTPVGDRIQGTRRPSGDQSGKNPGFPIGGAVRSPSVAQQPTQTSPAELADRPRMGSGDSYKAKDGVIGSRLPRMASSDGVGGAVQPPSPAPTGPLPPLAPQQTPASKMNGAVASARQPTRPPERALSPSQDGAERAQRFENNHSLFTSPQQSAGRDSPAIRLQQQAETRQPLSPGFGPPPSMMGSTETRQPLSPGFSLPPETPYFDAEEDPMAAQIKNRQKAAVKTYQPSQDPTGESLSRSTSRTQGTRSRQAENNTGRAESRADNMDRVVDSDTPRQSVQSSIVDAQEQYPKVTQRSFAQEKENEELPPQDSGYGSSPAMSQQFDHLSKELDTVKQKNAWFASELALARKSGYSGRPSADSPALDERSSAEIMFPDEDRPLIEALLKMRTELAKVQGTIEEQARNAGERIAQVEKQRDMAVNEAVFARARLAGHDTAGSARGMPEQERELQKKLAGALAGQSEMQRRLEALTAEVEGERKTRALGEETADAASRRVGELEALRQSQSAELEELRSELHETRTSARDLEVRHAEVSGQHQMLTVDKTELSGQLDGLRSERENHVGILASLREAVQASTQKSELLERNLDEERSGRDQVESKLRQLKNEHEDRTAELDTTTRRLRDAEDLAERHAQEARTHREAVLAGLDNVTNRSADNSLSANDERISILQQRVEEANAMVRQNQTAADAASQKLRSAEERIAGLEAYQEQASREGLAIRKQLQVAMREKQGVEGEKTALEQRLQGQLLETNALAVQHSSLKDILHERGINAAEVRRSRALDSPSSISNRFSTPDLHRVRDLEQQLEASLKSHDEMKTQFEDVSERGDQTKREYEEKLTALDNDHQAAVKYLRGTEKMLSKMKQELQRVKNENGDLRRRVEKAKEEEGASASARGVSADEKAEWERERSGLSGEVERAQAELKRSVGDMEARIREMQQQMVRSQAELEGLRTAHATGSRDLTSLQTTHEQARGDLERLQRENGMLEERARDAENKVQLLLDQVEHSVDNYRRQSRRISTAPPNLNHAGLMVNGTGGSHHQRNLSGASGISQSTVGTGHHVGMEGSGMGGMGHTRNLSDTNESTYSTDAPSTVGGDGGEHGGENGGGGRNSLALDALAGELDALRSHWETTNKTYRLSDNEYERHGGSAGLPGGRGGEPGHAIASTSAGGGQYGGLASWRRGLEIGDDGPEGDGESRPTTSEGTIRGEEEAEEEHAHAVRGHAATKTGM